MKDLWNLFITFSRIGLFTFGGGYAMLPMLQKEVVEKAGWATESEIMDYFAVGQCTPGVIAVNTATFIGYKNRGIIGAIFATLGLVFPSLIIIMILASFLQSFSTLPLVQSAFAGIRIAVIALIIDTVIKLFKSSIKDILGIIICLLAFILSAFLNISPVYIVISAALLGLISKAKRGER